MFKQSFVNYKKCIPRFWKHELKSCGTNKSAYVWTDWMRDEKKKEIWKERVVEIKKTYITDLKKIG